MERCAKSRGGSEDLLSLKNLNRSAPSQSQINNFKMKNKSFQHLLKIIPFVLLSTTLLAQDPVNATKNESGVMEWTLYNIVFIVGGIVIIGAFVALLNLFNKMIEVQKIRILEANGIVTTENVATIEQESWWSRMYERWTKAVPIKEEKDIMLDHDYDGIRELNNILPPWWVALFYVTIAMGVVYFAYYHVFDYGDSQKEEYEAAVAQAEKSVKAYLASRSDLVDESSVTVISDATQLAVGAAIYQTNCISCHGTAGEGNTIGPNLTDQYWLHGGNIKDVFKTIKYGVPEKGMISWKSQLRPADMQKVASYILSLQGTNPPNGKEAQGELYVPEEGENPNEEATGQMGMK